ncbi:hypothetical protein C6P44_002560 [Monosporozyma unispora]|nr:hypothetical protein C6P44_002560 [Kazachstania unispora]
MKYFYKDVFFNDYKQRFDCLILIKYDVAVDHYLNASRKELSSIKKIYCNGGYEKLHKTQYGWGPKMFWIGYNTYTINGSNCDILPPLKELIEILRSEARKQLKEVDTDAFCMTYKNSNSWNVNIEYSKLSTALIIPMRTQVISGISFL